jgi:hypothetical protein
MVPMSLARTKDVPETMVLISAALSRGALRAWIARRPRRRAKPATRSWNSFRTWQHAEEDMNTRERITPETRVSWIGRIG